MRRMRTNAVSATASQIETRKRNRTAPSSARSLLTVDLGVAPVSPLARARGSDPTARARGASSPQTRAPRHGRSSADAGRRGRRARAARRPRRPASAELRPCRGARVCGDEAPRARAVGSLPRARARGLTGATPRSTVSSDLALLGAVLFLFLVSIWLAVAETAFVRMPVSYT